MSIIIGLTGPTGAGKSIASLAIKNKGIKVIDCDKVAREAVLPNTEGLHALATEFGEEILNSDGTLNRKRLALLAFSSKENTERLNKTLLPYITDIVKERIDADKIVLDAPTLFESEIDSICNATVAVLSDEKLRLSRIIERDGLTIDEAKLRISAGKPDSFYKDKATKILYNNGETSDFITESILLFNDLFGGI